MQFPVRNINLAHTPGCETWATALAGGDTTVNFIMPERSPTAGKPESFHIVRSALWLKTLVPWQAGFAVYAPDGNRDNTALIVGRWANPASGRESSHYILQRGLCEFLGGDNDVGTDLCRGYFKVFATEDEIDVTIMSLSGHEIFMGRSHELSEAARTARKAFMQLERGDRRMVVDFERPRDDDDESRFSRFFR